ncbi:MAG: nickel/cobalt transporter [Chromatiales bacterium]|jgi:ABC-type nickel/cobalt efflux system permease component RcnA
MRVSRLVWLGLACFLVLALRTGLQAATVLPGEQPATAGSARKDQSTQLQQPSGWSLAVAWVWSQQREFHRALTKALRELHDHTSTGWALVLMSFLYGVFHAAGPGHGKAVLTTYLLTHRHRLRRGIAMGMTAALLQGLSALILVYGLTRLAGWLPRETETAAVWAGRTSFVLLVLVGIYICARAASSLLNGMRQRQRNTVASHHHDHHNDTHGETCGCRHLPNASEIETADNRRATAGVVLAIGLRPCTGAVLVLILASVMQLHWYGVLAVLAMSLGTALTIVILAILATKAREWASAVVAHRSPWWALAGCGFGVLGGVIVILLGLLLLNASFAVRPTLGW